MTWYVGDLVPGKEGAGAANVGLNDFSTCTGVYKVGIALVFLLFRNVKILQSNNSLV